MSAQFDDTILLDGIKYSIVQENGELLFDTQKYGFMPGGNCSACVRGYFADYCLRDNRIFLDNLYIETKDGKYPDLNGKSADSFNHDKYGIFAEIFHIYEDVSLPLSFTGALLVGSNFISDYGTYTCVQNPWAYENLAELVFENGVFVQKNDLSDIASQMRREVDALDLPCPDLSFLVYDKKSKYKGQFWWF